MSNMFLWLTFDFLMYLNVVADVKYNSLCVRVLSCGYIQIPQSQRAERLFVFSKKRLYTTVNSGGRNQEDSRLQVLVWMTT